MSGLLERLSSAYGPSANEKAVAKIIKEEISPFVDEIRTDALGNLIATVKGGKKRVCISAPMDQACLIARHIEKSGKIRFASMGTDSPLKLINARVAFEGAVQGVVLRDDESKGADGLFIDIGAKSRLEAEEAVRIGDVAVAKGEYYERDFAVIAPALSTRASCACLVDIIKRYTKGQKYEAYFVFSCQSLLGARGMQVAARAIIPEAAISIDSVPAGESSVYPGRGPIMRLRDGSAAGHPDLIRAIEDASQDLNMTVERAVDLKEMSDVSGISRAGLDATAISLGYAVKNRHTASEIINVGDIERLACLILNVLDSERI